MFTAIALICQIGTTECESAKSVDFYDTEEECLAALLDLKVFMLKTGKYVVQDATCIGWVIDNETF